MVDIPLAAPRRNIELKARLPSLERARATALAVATADLGVQRQIDTYFRAASGRLKLRQIDGQTSQLIGYIRHNATSAKGSDYRLVEVADGRTLCELLSESLGTLVVVDKRREIFLHENVRIHLDDVVGLGSFIEFEAVLGPEIDDVRGHAQVAALTEQFALPPSDWIADSYSDLLLRQG